MSEDSKDRVFLAVPHYDQMAPQAFSGLMLATQKRRCTIQLECGSLLACCFNRLWCKALNLRGERNWTHFAMHHADIESTPFWLDTITDELHRVGADVMSVVIPIKDERGLTTTGVQDSVTHNVRRFTMTEIMQMPETFCAADIGEAGKPLMVNTGLWVCDFTKPWVEDMCFTILDAVVRGKDGIFRARTMPEDWGFSRFCHNRKLKVYATRKVPVGHWGRKAYGSMNAWGTWETDLGDEPPIEEKAA
jgi:hypothetical protein